MLVQQVIYVDLRVESLATLRRQKHFDNKNDKVSYIKYLIILFSRTGHDRCLVSEFAAVITLFLYRPYECMVVHRRPHVGIRRARVCIF